MLEKLGFERAPLDQGGERLQWNLLLNRRADKLCAVRLTADIPERELQSLRDKITRLLERLPARVRARVGTKARYYMTYEYYSQTHTGTKTVEISKEQYEKGPPPDTAFGGNAELFTEKVPVFGSVPNPRVEGLKQVPHEVSRLLQNVQEE